MNGSLSHVRHNAAAAKEYFWGCKLTKDKPEQMWAPAKKEEEEEEDDDDFVQETLFLRHAVLDVGAVKGERNIVEVKTKTFQGKTETVTVIASLTLGANDMCSLDVNFNHDIPATFKLIEGSGPVCLVGQHLVEFAEDYDDLDMTEGDLSEANDSFKKVMPGKRKRGKIDGKAENGADDDDDDEDEEDEEDDPESEEEDDDDDASDVEEEEEEEEDMEEDSPKKRKASSQERESKGEDKQHDTRASQENKAPAHVKKPVAKKASKKAAK